LHWSSCYTGTYSNWSFLATQCPSPPKAIGREHVMKSSSMSTNFTVLCPYMSLNFTSWPLQNELWSPVGTRLFNCTKLYLVHIHSLVSLYHTHTHRQMNSYIIKSPLHYCYM
jgi:hypothetical protein